MSEAADAPPTLLVVEDEEAVRLGIVDFLEDEGFRVVEAADGAEGQRGPYTGSSHEPLPIT